MAANTKIEWADHTFNPWVGCTKISPGCDHCYAEGWAKRTGDAALWQGNRRRTSDANWRLPLKWNREAEAAGVRRRVFCASLADMFDNQAEVSWRHALWELIHDTPHLDWLLLTKRPQNIAKMLPNYDTHPLPDWGQGWPNVWLGTTVENQAEADRRIPLLLGVPAAKRFLSCEPLLGPVDLTAVQQTVDPGFFGDCLQWYHKGYCHEIEGISYPTIDWVIAGGESGPGARPMHPNWARSLRDQCAAAGVPFLFKQWGEWAPADRPIGPPTYVMPDGTLSIDGHP